MPFISYAQNYEDVMLYRALKNIERGFYIDVGAYDPVIDSVTKAFYERGWRGINVEPVRHWYDKLIVDRPEDLNLNAGISDQPGILRIYDVQGTGLSTSNKDFAENHSKELGFQSQEILVPALTLDSVLQGFSREIHFLKVDVEGAEKQVLASIDLTRTRPWIILVEATKPYSQVENFEDWETLLIDRAYTFVYFDGLNRFYVSADKNELMPAFGSPPNVFDDFIQFKHWNTQTKLNIKEAERLQLEASLNLSRQELLIELQNSKLKQQRFDQLLSSSMKQKNEIQHWIDEVNRHQVELKSVYASHSWRITAPMRKIKDIVHSILHKFSRLFPLHTLPKRATLNIIRSISMWIIVRPNVDRVVIAVVNRFPGIKNRLKKIVYGTMQSSNHTAFEAKEYIPMSPEVKSIYMDLVNKINNNKQVSN